MDAWLKVVERDWMWLKYLALSLEALRSVGKNLQGTMASTRQNIAPFIMIVAWFKVPLLQKEWVPCWMWLKCDWTWLKYSWLISIRMWLLSIEISLQSISITINQDQSLLEFSDEVFALTAGLYGCQVWATSSSTYDSSKITPTHVLHLGFLKRLLGVKKSTDTHCVLRETGQMPILF